MVIDIVEEARHLDRGDAMTGGRSVPLAIVDEIRRP
jgi:hypothetical protein